MLDLAERLQDMAANEVKRATRDLKDANKACSATTKNVLTYETPSPMVDGILYTAKVPKTAEEIACDIENKVEAQRRLAQWTKQLEARTAEVKKLGELFDAKNNLARLSRQANNRYVELLSSPRIVPSFDGGDSARAMMAAQAERTPQNIAARKAAAENAAKTAASVQKEYDDYVGWLVKSYPYNQFEIKGAKVK